MSELLNDGALLLATNLELTLADASLDHTNHRLSWADSEGVLFDWSVEIEAGKFYELRVTAELVGSTIRPELGGNVGLSSSDSGDLLFLIQAGAANEHLRLRELVGSPEADSTLAMLSLREVRVFPVAPPYLT